MHTDLLLPTVAWEAVSTDLSEFPVTLAEQVVRLYHLYAKIIRYHELLAESFDEYSEVDFQKRQEAQENFHVVEHALSTAMTDAIGVSEVLLPNLDVEIAMSMLPGRRPRLTG